MIELLNSNILTLKTENKRFEDIFYFEFMSSIEVNIASSYISEDSISQIIRLYQKGADTTFNLIVGMHYFEGFTKTQYESLIELNKYIKKHKGGVYLATVSKYHGKVYSFLNNKNKYSSVIGSSNLTKISSHHYIYDTDLYLKNENINKEIYNFLLSIRYKYCTSIDGVDINKIKIIEKNIFEDFIGVEKISSLELDDIVSKKSKKYFEIELKVEEKSNLNVFFGRGRVNQYNKNIIIPRDWYEVEIIVSKDITSKNGYPRNKEFIVYTDDGYKFKCKTSGDFSKNFRSSNDLRILGKWIKGRMENAGVLKIGEKVTKETLKKYGKDKIVLSKTKISNVWFLDFGGNNALFN